MCNIVANLAIVDDIPVMARTIEMLINLKGSQSIDSLATIATVYIAPFSSCTLCRLTTSTLPLLPPSTRSTTT